MTQNVEHISITEGHGICCGDAFGARNKVETRRKTTSAPHIKTTSKNTRTVRACEGEEVLALVTSPDVYFHRHSTL